MALLAPNVLCSSKNKNRNGTTIFVEFDLFFSTNWELFKKSAVIKKLSSTSNKWNFPHVRIHGIQIFHTQINQNYKTGLPLDKLILAFLRNAKMCLSHTFLWHVERLIHIQRTHKKPLFSVNKFPKSRMYFLESIMAPTYEKLARFLDFGVMCVTCLWKPRLETLKPAGKPHSGPLHSRHC